MSVCKWCGSRQQGDYGHGFACESYESVAGAVVQSYVCQQRCLELRLQNEQTIEFLKAREANTVEALRGHIEDLHKRIADAVAALAAIERIERHEAGADVGFERVSEHGDWVLFEDLEPVRDILTGNSPEESEDEQ